jgi:hypothetical protein
MPLSAHLARLKQSLPGAASSGDGQRLPATVSAEGRSGVRRLRVRGFQVLSDSDRTLAGDSLGAGSWDTEVKDAHPITGRVVRGHAQPSRPSVAPAISAGAQR